jgi:hypothetical protein
MQLIGIKLMGDLSSLKTDGSSGLGYKADSTVDWENGIRRKQCSCINTFVL